MYKNCLKSTKLFIVIILLVIYILYFGIPSVKNYLKKDTVFVTSKKDLTSDDLPAIGINKIISRLKYECWNDGENLTECLEKQTENFNEIVNISKIISFSNSNIDADKIFSEEDWETSFVSWRHGRIFVLQTLNMTSKQRFVIEFMGNIDSVLVELHDRNYFLEKSHNMVDFLVSTTTLRDQEAKEIFIVITEYNLLPDESHCNDDQNYSFLKCTKVGTKLNIFY